MSTSVQAVAEEAMKLSPQDREILVERPIASLEPAEPLHPGWRDEIARRVADMEAGRTRFIPADEAMARLTAHIHRRRSAA
jgi:putative addiction module component (TIGR02574 family)